MAKKIQINDFEEMVVCKVCEKYYTSNTDTEVCFRCQDKIEKEKGTNEDLSNCYEEDFLIEEIDKFESALKKI